VFSWCGDFVASDWACAVNLQAADMVKGTAVEPRPLVGSSTIRGASMASRTNRRFGRCRARGMGQSKSPESVSHMGSKTTTSRSLGLDGVVLIR
jgi:hypothetical protein